MTLSDMISALSDHGARTDTLEAMLDEYHANGIIELTAEQIKDYYNKIFPERRQNEKRRYGI